MRKLMMAALAATCSSAAMGAGTPDWTVSESSGPVQISHNGVVKIAVRGSGV